MRWVCRFSYSLLCILCALTLSAVGYLQYTLPDVVSVTDGDIFHIGTVITEHRTDSALSAAAVEDSYAADLSLGGYIPIKPVTVSVVDRPTVMVCGTPFGIKLYTEGVLVVGMSDVTTAAGNTNPAATAGVCIGDTLLAIDGQQVSTNKQVSRLISSCGGKPLTFILRRDGITFEATVTPVRPVGESGYRAGLWVRDSGAGVGTLTFYDPATGAFGGLGHPVCDTDTGTRLVISGGEIVPARIFGVKPGLAGNPGELQGTFMPGSLGTLHQNARAGLYGQLSVYPLSAKSMPVALRQEVKTGLAHILTTIDGDTPALYEVQIRQVRYNTASTRHMVVEVTDQNLLSKTGGIVQGMSVCYN